MTVTIRDKVQTMPIKPEATAAGFLRAKQKFLPNFRIIGRAYRGTEVSVADEDAEDFLELVEISGFEFEVDNVEDPEVAQRLKEAGLLSA